MFPVRKLRTTTGSRCLKMTKLGECVLACLGFRLVCVRWCLALDVCREFAREVAQLRPGHPGHAVLRACDTRMEAAVRGWEMGSHPMVVC